ncbi:MAG: Rossmann-like domain-containing protein [Saccharofermentanales bacterium]|jgi:uncharacterized protein (DUF4213/DUF364 family)
MIANKLIELAMSKAGDRKIKDLRAGLSYTAVLLDDDACGLAYTFRNELGCFCGILHEAGSIIGRSATEVIPWLDSKNLLKASMGLATINAVLNTASDRWEEGNVVTALEVNPADTFGMVGNFGPILNVVRKKTDDIYVFEKQKEKGLGLYSDADIPTYLPKCDVVVVTATSIINHTVDDVLSHCTGAREVCLVGPSCPMSPEIFKDYGVTMLAGDVVTTPEQVLRIVSQGGGTRALKHSMSHVLYRIPR